MADSVENPIGPTKQSTVASLLGKAQTSITSFTSSLTGGTTGKVAGDTSTSLFTSPILWIGVVIAGAAVYFMKFKKPARQGVKFRR